MFTAEGAEALAGPAWLRARRRESFAAFQATPAPSEKEEIWRYSPIDRLDLDAYAPVAGPVPLDLPADGAAFVEGVSADLPARAALVVVHDGHVVGGVDGALPAGVSVRSAATVDEAPPIGTVLGASDAIAVLNDAFHPDAVVVDVAAGVSLASPIVVVHWCAAARAAGGGPLPAAFPRTLVRVGASAEASLVEVVAGASDGLPSLVAPVVEAAVEDGGNLAYLSLQVLGPGAWHIGRFAGTVGRDAALRTFTMGLGGAYDRIRSDVTAVGQGGSTQLRSAYFGSDDQVHDIRTLQDHVAPRTTSDLLCKGAVTGTSRSVYSGLIRVRRGAVRADAMQSNHNLVLAEGAHADSVPNLDIQENDVRCSHASTVGPIDEDQRYYLASRGIRPERADALIVRGFFDDVIDQVPVPAAAPRLRREVGARLHAALGLAGPGGPPAGEPGHG